MPDRVWNSSQMVNLPARNLVKNGHGDNTKTSEDQEKPDSGQLISNAFMEIWSSTAESLSRDSDWPAPSTRRAIVRPSSSRYIFLWLDFQRSFSSFTQTNSRLNLIFQGATFFSHSTVLFCKSFFANLLQVYPPPYFPFEEFIRLLLIKVAFQICI